MLTRITNAALPLATVFFLACGGGGGASGGDTTPTGGTGGGDQISSGGDVTASSAGDGSGADANLVNEGASVFGEYCASCHGDDGEGGGGTPAVSGTGALMSYTTDQALFEYVKAEMPQDDPGSLSDAQYKAVVAWMSSKSGR